MTEETKKKILEILHQETTVDPNSINPDIPIQEQISFDSMQFISLVARLELTLNISIPSAIMSVSTLNDFLAILDPIISE